MGTSRSVVQPVAGRARRGGHQGGVAPEPQHPRHRWAACARIRADTEHRRPLQRHQRQQAQRYPQHPHAPRPGPGQEARLRVRHRDRELRVRRARPVGPGLRGHEEAKTGHHLPVHVGLRAHRPRPRLPTDGADRAGVVRPDLHLRPARGTARGLGLVIHGRYRRLLWRHLRAERAVPPQRYGRGPAR